MRIAVDAMGGDHGCDVVVFGAKLALERDDGISRIFLVGNQREIQAALDRHHCRDTRVAVVHAAEVLSMEDKPVEGLRRKRDCSIARAVDLLKEGQAEALVSPGNTGGVVAASTIKLRPLAGVDRPAIATIMPAPENDFVLLDAGANIECRPQHLAQYAVMGSVYAREILGIKKPRVGLLSVGTEAVKGNELTLETYQLCKMLALNFIGNVEGHDLFTNRVDVVVCDGFVGNIVLKSCESLATGIFTWLRKELTRNPLRRAGAIMAQGAFRTIKKRVDPDTHGGAPLLGLNGTVVITHGSSREKAIMNAIRLATEALQNQVNESIGREINAANVLIATTKPQAGSSAL
jgi:glycerol-3-phosphate acyltransferase PlsX